MNSQIFVLRRHPERSEGPPHCAFVLVSALQFRPLPQQVVIHPGQADCRRLDGCVPHRRQALNGLIQLMQQGAPDVLADHALNPEEAADPVAAGHRLNPVQAVGRVKHQMPGRQLDRVLAVAVFNDQFPALIFMGRREKERGGKIGADALRRDHILADGRVDM